MNGVLEKVVAEQPHDSTRNHENVAILSNIRDVPAVLDPFFSAGAGCVREWQRFVKRDDFGAGGVEVGTNNVTVAGHVMSFSSKEDGVFDVNAWKF